MKLSKKAKFFFTMFAVFVLVFSITTTAFATDDPLEVVNNLSEFIFGLIRAIGIILLAFGIVQIGLALKSHDPSQRANGFLTLAGGVIICQPVSQKYRTLSLHDDKARRNGVLGVMECEGYQNKKHRP